MLRKKSKKTEELTGISIVSHPPCKASIIGNSKDSRTWKPQISNTAKFDTTLNGKLTTDVESFQFKLNKSFFRSREVVIPYDSIEAINLDNSQNFTKFVEISYFINSTELNYLLFRFEHSKNKNAFIHYIESHQKLARVGTHNTLQLEEDDEDGELGDPDKKHTSSGSIYLLEPNTVDIDPQDKHLITYGKAKICRMDLYDSFPDQLPGMVFDVLENKENLSPEDVVLWNNSKSLWLEDTKKEPNVIWSISQEQVKRFYSFNDQSVVLAIENKNLQPESYLILRTDQQESKDALEGFLNTIDPEMLDVAMKEVRETNTEDLNSGVPFNKRNPDSNSTNNINNKKRDAKNISTSYRSIDRVYVSENIPPNSTEEEIEELCKENVDPSWSTTMFLDDFNGLFMFSARRKKNTSS